MVVEKNFVEQNPTETPNQGSFKFEDTYPLQIIYFKLLLIHGYKFMSMIRISSMGVSVLYQKISVNKLKFKLCINEKEKILQTDFRVSTSFIRKQKPNNKLLLQIIILLYTIRKQIYISMNCLLVYNGTIPTLEDRTSRRKEFNKQHADYTTSIYILIYPMKMCIVAYYKC